MIRTPARVVSIGALVPLLGIFTGCAGSGAGSEYRGTYVRTWVDLNGSVRQATGAVRLRLDPDGAYQIAGDRRDHPPRGRGRYEKPGDGTLVLDDRAFTTAGFDLSLVLDGTFDLAEDEGGRIVLRQENLWGHTHHLILEPVAVAGPEGGP